MPNNNVKLGTRDFIITPDNQYISFNISCKPHKSSSWWYNNYFFFDRKAFGFPTKDNIINLKSSDRDKTTFLIWCLRQPTSFDKKVKYYQNLPIVVFIKYILTDILIYWKN